MSKRQDKVTKRLAELLLEYGPVCQHFSYELWCESGLRSWRLYRSLDQMVDKGWIDRTSGSNGRTFYVMNAEGEKAITAWLQENT